MRTNRCARTRGGSRRSSAACPKASAPAHLRVLGFVTLAMFFENYDLGMFGNALPQLAATFGLDKAQLGQFAGATRLGALPAFFLLPLGRPDRTAAAAAALDRRDEHRLAGDGAGADAASVRVGADRDAHVHHLGGADLVRRRRRGVSRREPRLGHRHARRRRRDRLRRGRARLRLRRSAAVRLARALRARRDPAPAPAGARAGAARDRALRRRARGERGQRGAGGSCGRSSSCCGATRGARSRSALLGCLSSAGIGPSLQFISEFLQTERGWTPAAFASLSVFFGAFAIIGNPVAGRLGDRYGRRAVAACVLVGLPAGVSRVLRGTERDGLRCRGR